jgi:hypothetical protein
MPEPEKVKNQLLNGETQQVARRAGLSSITMLRPEQLVLAIVALGTYLAFLSPDRRFDNF